MMESTEKVRAAAERIENALSRVPAGDVDAVVAAFIPKVEGAVEFLEAKAALEKKGGVRVCLSRSPGRGRWP